MQLPHVRLKQSEGGEQRQSLHNCDWQNDDFTQCIAASQAQKHCVDDGAAAMPMNDVQDLLVLAVARNKEVAVKVSSACCLRAAPCCLLLPA